MGKLGYGHLTILDEYANGARRPEHDPPRLESRVVAGVFRDFKSGRGASDFLTRAALYRRCQRIIGLNLRTAASARESVRLSSAQHEIQQPGGPGDHHGR